MKDEINVLVFGDIFGKSGRNIVSEKINGLKKKYSIDLAIANIENLAHGKGITEKTINEMVNCGVDFFTSGNHIFSKRNFAYLLDSKDYDIIRPANYPDGVDGKGWKIIEVCGLKFLIMNLMGRVFIHQDFDCPFRKAEKILNAEKKNYDICIVDFHAETTSEKIAMKFFLQNKVSLLFGTHTHVATNDSEIKDGMAYITDVGMCGSHGGVIGLDYKNILKRYLTQTGQTIKLAEGNEKINAIVVCFDKISKTASSIKQILI